MRRRGAACLVDGKPAVVWELFPTGSTSFLHPHAIIVFDGSREQVKVALHRVKFQQAPDP